MRRIKLARTTPVSFERTTAGYKKERWDGVLLLDDEDIATLMEHRIAILQLRAGFLRLLHQARYPHAKPKGVLPPQMLFDARPRGGADMSGAERSRKANNKMVNEVYQSIRSNLDHEPPTYARTQTWRDKRFFIDEL